MLAANCLLSFQLSGGVSHVAHLKMNRSCEWGFRHCTYRGNPRKVSVHKIRRTSLWWLLERIQPLGHLMGFSRPSRLHVFSNIGSLCLSHYLTHCYMIHRTYNVTCNEETAKRGFPKTCCTPQDIPLIRFVLLPQLDSCAKILSTTHDRIFDFWKCFLWFFFSFAVNAAATHQRAVSSVS